MESAFECERLPIASPNPRVAMHIFERYLVLTVTVRDVEASCLSEKANKACKTRGQDDAKHVNLRSCELMRCIQELCSFD
jgi:hypothetical protein